FAKRFHDRPGINPGGRLNGGERGGGRGFGEQLQSQWAGGGAGHFGGELCVGDQGVATGGEIALTGLAYVVQGRAQSSDERDGGGEGRFAFGCGLPLLVQVEVVAG